ncbi:MAG TPA: diaminopimelate epimerase [Solirubrobacteraceae bacterium]|nr:diaminopimelate epimerase [Solirubrobacteraceae bacterium]
MRFEKWQALGNDYMIVEHAELPFELTPERIRKLCARHFGLFADGVLLLTPCEDPRFVAHLRIYNPDGSEAELSGNGAREAILYLRRRGWTDEDVFSIQTAAGEIRPTITGPDTCRVDMGHAQLSSKDFPDGPEDGTGELVADGRAWSFRHVSIGNPQCAIHVEDLATLEALDLPSIGPAIEAHELFPNRTNVSWYTQLEPGTIRARIFERGVGETLSSGTGATGAAVAHVLSGHASAAAKTSSGAQPTESITVNLDGGQLNVGVGEDLHIELTGWARPVFAGRLSEEFVGELTDTDEGAA